MTLNIAGFQTAIAKAGGDYDLVVFRGKDVDTLSPKRWEKQKESTEWKDARQAFIDCLKTEWRPDFLDVCKAFFKDDGEPLEVREVKWVLKTRDAHLMFPLGTSTPDPELPKPTSAPSVPEILPSKGMRRIKVLSQSDEEGIREYQASEPRRADPAIRDTPLGQITEDYSWIEPAEKYSEPVGKYLPRKWQEPLEYPAETCEDGYEVESALDLQDFIAEQFNAPPAPARRALDPAAGKTREKREKRENQSFLSGQKDPWEDVRKVKIVAGTRLQMTFKAIKKYSESGKHKSSVSPDIKAFVKLFQNRPDCKALDKLTDGKTSLAIYWDLIPDKWDNWLHRLANTRTKGDAIEIIREMDLLLRQLDVDATAIKDRLDKGKLGPLERWDLNVALKQLYTLQDKLEISKPWVELQQRATEIADALQDNDVQLFAANESYAAGRKLEEMGIPVVWKSDDPVKNNKLRLERIALANRMLPVHKQLTDALRNGSDWKTVYSEAGPEQKKLLENYRELRLDGIAGAVTESTLMFDRKNHTYTIITDPDRLDLYHRAKWQLTALAWQMGCPTDLDDPLLVALGLKIEDDTVRKHASVSDSEDDEILVVRESDSSKHASVSESDSVSDSGSDTDSESDSSKPASVSESESVSDSDDGDNGSDGDSSQEEGR